MNKLHARSGKGQLTLRPRGYESGEQPPAIQRTPKLTEDPVKALIC